MKPVAGIRFKLNKSLYIRDPQDTALGRNILKYSIILINSIGFEAFNFKKLAHQIGSGERSIYRYFDNKHLLLVYLNSWYSEWMSYLININTLNINDAETKLKKTIHCVIYASQESELTEYINEELLFKVILQESSKSYHINDIDKENKEGLFSSYKDLVNLMASIILENNKSFKYPHSLCSTIIEMINNQIFYSEHLPRLSNLKYNKERIYKDLEVMVNHFCFNVIK